MIPDASLGRWKTSDIYSSIIVAKEWDLMPSDFGVCHPFEDKDVIFAFEIARDKIEAYEIYLRNEQQHHKAKSKKR